MDCVKLKKLLSAYMDGELDARTHEAVQTHLQKCEDCKEELLSLKEMVREMGSLDDLKAPTGFMEKVHERIENPSWPERIRSLLFFPAKSKIPVEIAALTTTAVLIFFLFNSFQSDRAVSDIPPGNGEKIVAMDSRKENKPVQLAIRLGPAEGQKPLPSENVVPVNSGSRRQGLHQNGFGLDSPDRNHGEWGQNRAASYRDDFLSDIHMIITHLKGRLLSKEYREGTDILQYITLEIPADNYRPFLMRLERIGSLQTPASNLPEGYRDRVPLRIRIISLE